ncbi:MAG TPA: PH domain-containing protein [Candidatus Saccharimonadales bacterium]|nr:PH domain-containing protein [Candidatus Saccharimonadales bacterium]
MAQPNLSGYSQLPVKPSSTVQHAVTKGRTEEVRTQLQQAGADWYDLKLPETDALPTVMRPAERVLGVVYGRYHHLAFEGEQVSRGMLVATDQRLLLLNKKPLFIRCDEIMYEVVSSVSYAQAGFGGTVTLHSKIGDIMVRTFNQHCAVGFISALEGRLFALRVGQEVFHG